MDITYLSPNVIKIKGKKASLVIDPDKSTKTAADVVLLLQTQETTHASFPSIESHRLVIIGPGEYEVSGMKIAAFLQGGLLVYVVRVDGMTLFISKASSAKSGKDAPTDYEIVLLQTDEFDASIVTSLAPKILVLYGDDALGSAKKIGKDDLAAVAKYQTSLEKLPQELEVVVLG